jgi:hypothetical protein
MQLDVLARKALWQEGLNYMVSGGHVLKSHQLPTVVLMSNFFAAWDGARRRLVSQRARGPAIILHGCAACTWTCSHQ